MTRDPQSHQEPAFSHYDYLARLVVQLRSVQLSNLDGSSLENEDSDNHSCSDSQLFRSSILNDLTACGALALNK